MVMGLDIKKRARKTGFVVGRLKTAKSDVKLGGVRQKGRRGTANGRPHKYGEDDTDSDNEMCERETSPARKFWSGGGKLESDSKGRRRGARNGGAEENFRSVDADWKRKRHGTIRDKETGYIRDSFASDRNSRDSDGRVLLGGSAKGKFDAAVLPNRKSSHYNIMHSDKRNSTEEGSKGRTIRSSKDYYGRKTKASQDSKQTCKAKDRTLLAEAHSGNMRLKAKPKKKKEDIRLDPHDISNKRIDDSAPTDEKVGDNEIELSKNAQFRAIKPSPSILTFVENNLLGRRRTNELKNAGYNIDLSAPLDNIPFSTSTERERIEESVFRNKLEFFAAAKVSSSFPPPVLPEIAFAGRSNVGKSSLLNALTRQWGVVRTSDKPGHTQTINFFRLASKLCLVDLPGYGFAYAKEEVKDAWEELVKEYVSTREGLQKVCLLIDTKWGMKPRDHELIDLMERSKTPYQIVLTKTDVVFPIDVARRAMQVQEELKTRKSIVNPVMMLSSQSGAGIRSLRTVLAKFARFIKP